MKYPMKNKNEKPLFEYLVRVSNEFDYWLFDNFDEAMSTLRTLSIGKVCRVNMYEVYFNTKTREFHTLNTFHAFDGKLEYDKFANPDLHIEFYVNAGEWMNPNETWVEQLATNN